MQKAEIVLANLNRKSRNKEDYQFTRLYRNLFNPWFFLNAYAKLASNAGKLTKGVDETTIDGFGGKRIKNLIEALRYERYKPKPVRRIYIPKKSGKFRPLGIPSFYDKVVQEIVRQILEAIYEPIFSRNSHGFRPHRSCHTALQQIRQTGNGTSWIIEGDIKGFFDNIDHDIMIDILSRRIKDGRFLWLIKMFLKSGVMEEGKVRDTLSGAPQGGVISPILSNIYLHELDTYMEEISNREYRGEVRQSNKEYSKIHARKLRRIKAGKLKEAKELLQIQRKLSAKDSMDPNYRRVRYIRYADDFVVLIIGPKSMAERIKSELSQFLFSKLKIELSKEKTVITNPLKKRCRFLGYDIVKGNDYTQVTKTVNGRKVRAVKGVLQLLVPGDVIREKIRPFQRHGKPAHRTDRVNTPIEGLIAQYNNEIRGLVNYYCMGANVARQLYRFKYFHYFSLVKTVGLKFKLSMRKTLRKYGIDVRRKQGTGTRRILGVVHQTKNGPKQLAYFNASIKRIKNPHSERIAEYEAFAYHESEIIQRLSYGQCELCGCRSEPMNLEVHHIKKVKDLKIKYEGKEQPNWVKTMIRMRRTSLVLCSNCHRSIHGQRFSA